MPALTTAASFAAAAPPDSAYGINIQTLLAIFTGVILVLAGIFLGAIMLFKSHRVQTGDLARTLLNVCMALFAGFLLIGGAGWFVVTHVGDAVVQSK